MIDGTLVATDRSWMLRAIELAKKGEGWVEPNPQVGCVLVKDNELIGEGWHAKFGGPHAEVNALSSASAEVRGATAYVMLEPCAHHGKTPPCSQALIDAGVTKVIIAHGDPNPQVSGKGIAQLKQAGIDVEIGLLKDEAADVLAPYLKRLATATPWTIAKWAMTLDGKIATAAGDSQWISNEQSRAVVHSIRGRVDGIMVGSNTAKVDDPRLTARPAGPRIATRIVLDSTAKISPNSKLCLTAREFPTLIAVASSADRRKIEALEKTGCEIWKHASDNAPESLLDLLHEISKRGMTNLLVEGGAGLLGSFNDLDQIDESHVFISSKILGGQNSLGPFAGVGAATISTSRKMQIRSVQQLGDDVYIIGRRTSAFTPNP